MARGGRRAAQLQYSLAVDPSADRLPARAVDSSRLGIDAKRLDKSIGTANAEIGRVNSLLAAGNFDAAYERASVARRILAERSINSGWIASIHRNSTAFRSARVTTCSCQRARVREDRLPRSVAAKINCSAATSKIWAS